MGVKFPCKTLYATNINLLKKSANPLFYALFMTKVSFLLLTRDFLMHFMFLDGYVENLELERTRPNIPSMIGT